MSPHDFEEVALEENARFIRELEELLREFNGIVADTEPQSQSQTIEPPTEQPTEAQAANDPPVLQSTSLAAQFENIPDEEQKTFESDSDKEEEDGFVVVPNPSLEQADEKE